MKIDYISDVHLDFWVKEKNPLNDKIQKQIETFCFMTNIKKETAGDVLIIAGDLGHYYAQDTTFLIYLKEIYKHIILVNGNHDMYLVSKGQQEKYLYNSMNRILEMKRFCNENDIHYLDGNVVVIDGYKFAGCGMSWDDSYFQKIKGYKPSRNELTELFNNTMNDPKLIYGGSDNIRIPTAYGGSYFKSSFNPFDFFEKENSKLKNINDFDDIDVMVSHYSPIAPPTMKMKYAMDPISTFYYFDGKSDVERISPKYWIFGHTHDKYNFEYKQTTFLCNPIGYPGENNYTVVESFEI